MKSFRPGRFLAALLAGVLLCGLALAANRESVTIPFPRGGGEVPVGLTNGPLLIRSVTLQGRPDHDDVRDSRRDPGDDKVLRWVFHVANGARRDWRARVQVTVLSRDGRVLARNDRWSEIDGWDFKDRITVLTKIRTRNYLAADRVRIDVEPWR